MQAQKHAAPPGYKVFSRNSEIGGAFGVGVGLYFKVISWLKWMFLLLTFCAVRPGTRAGLYMGAL